ncbi:hypothetical protein DPMN_039194 [Dreissena polymorpha]|uniref:Uncharacterized protein n=1 Tax=Dreissena polymorpha TaxID=45954 RepID=A0A9D4RRG5_DREPO|nr:hypothetical protein DPMN_039194 [Dreissena polymorpha]
MAAKPINQSEGRSHSITTNQKAGTGINRRTVKQDGAETPSFTLLISGCQSN